MTTDTRDSRLTLANALTAFRLVVAAPLMLICAFIGARQAFLYVLVAAFFSDAIDGTVARLSGRATRFGAMLDSWADVAAYSAIAIAVTRLWPELLAAERAAFGAIVTSFLLPSAIGLFKFGQFTSYHTRLVKLAVGTTAVCLTITLWGGPGWLLRLAAAIDLLAAGEEIAITCLLRAPRSDVKSVYAVWRGRRSN